MSWQLLQPEILRAVDTAVGELLQRAGVPHPPVYPIELARQLGLPVAFDTRQQTRGRHTRLRGRSAIFVKPDDRPERLSWAVAHELGEASVHVVLAHSGRGSAAITSAEREEIANVFASRLLLPTASFVPLAQAVQGSLLELKRHFSTASHELIAWRLLDLPEPSIISVFDQGRLTRRRSNVHATPPGLHPRERECWRDTHVANVPATVKHEGMTVYGWPIHEPGWNREVLRTTLPEEPEW